MVCGIVSLGLEEEVPSGITISSVPLVEQVNRDSLGETEEVEGQS